ncbi:MAG: DUF2029 domain-containing protein [Gammaproteobacteria bacterium]|nr:DUF2029 domain-containing protein [Gammaproteobacteria bacterium]
MQRNFITGFLSLTGILLLYVYGMNIFHLASHNLNTDLMLTYLSGKMLNANTPGYQFSSAYLSAHHEVKTNIIPNLSPPFSIALMAFIAKYLSYKSFFISFMTTAISINIIALAKLYQNTYLDRGKHYKLTLCAFILACLIYIPTFMNISFGQVALVLNAIVIFSYLSLKNKQYKRAGFLLALAINIKVFFGIFLVYFLAKKQYLAFFSLIIFCLLLALIPLAIYGTSIYIGYWKVLNNIQWYGVNWNASWYGFLSRFLGEKSHRFHSMLFFPELSKNIYYFIFFSYIGLIYYISKKNKDSSLTFSLTLSTMLLISPLGWTYYFPILITAFIINFSSLESNRYYVLLTCLLLFSLFLSALPFPIYRDTKTATNILMTQGNIFFLALLFFNTVNLLQLFFPAIKNNAIHILTKKFKLFIICICLLPSLMGMSCFIYALTKSTPQNQSQNRTAMANSSDLLPSNTD